MSKRLFWKIQLAWLVLLFGAFLIANAYVTQTLRQEHVTTAFAQLEAWTQLARIRPPDPSSQAEMHEWTAWMAKNGARVSIITQDGKMLADSDANAAKMENYAERPEVLSAIAEGTGRAVRHSQTLRQDAVYLAILYRPPDHAPFVLRLSLPLTRFDEAISLFRWRLSVVALFVFVISGGICWLAFLSISTRIERIRAFVRRIASEDLRPLPKDLRQDEMANLTNDLNEAATSLERKISSLTEERNQAAAILASMMEGVAVIGLNQRLTFCNAAFRKAVGVENTPWEGRPAVEVIPHSDLLEFIQQALSGNSTFRKEIVVGSVRTRTFAVPAAPVHSDDGTAGAVIVLHDISEHRRLERARRDFVANVSHEFKTPLTAIQGFAETLLAGAMDDRSNSRRFIEIIRDNAIRLERLTSDMLKLSQIEAGRLALEFRTVDIVEVIESCMETTRLKANLKALSLYSECSPDILPVSGDRGSLTEVLQNLLDNAVRYSQPGGRITVKAVVIGTDVVLSVSDTGIGIPSSEQERIFERFYRADTARSRELGGTGLGLAIVKHLVEAHGGRVQLESELGQGSTFSVILPGIKREEVSARTSVS